MKKVLFLSPLPPPHYGSAMSSEMCLNILKESKEFEVKNIKLNYSKDMKDIGKINFEKIKGIFRVKKEIRKKILEFNPEVIYFVPATSSYGLIRDWMFVKEIKKYWKGKIWFHVRSRILDKDWNGRKRKFISEIFKDQKAIVLGKELVADLHSLIDKKNVFVLPNAIKNEISEKELKKIIIERKKNKKFKILFLSNMDKEKGWMKVLDACKILNEKGFDFECNFVGAWKSRKEKKGFDSFVLRNNLERKVFSVGKKTGKEKAQFLEKANVLVFPTEYQLETFGRVILEAWMFDIPVIANGIASIPSTIQNGKNGFVLRENTGEEIAQKILEEKDWEKLGLNGRKRFLKDFELEKYGEEFLDILKKV